MKKVFYLLLITLMFILASCNSLPTQESIAIRECRDNIISVSESENGEHGYIVKTKTCNIEVWRPSLEGEYSQTGFLTSPFPIKLSKRDVGEIINLAQQHQASHQPKNSFGEGLLTMLLVIVAILAIGVVMGFRVFLQKRDRNISGLPVLLIFLLVSCSERASHNEGKIPTLWEDINYLSKVDTLEIKSGEEFYRITSKHYQAIIYHSDSTGYYGRKLGRNKPSTFSKTEAGRVLSMMYPIQRSKTYHHRGGILFNYMNNDAKYAIIIEKSYSNMSGDRVNSTKYPREFDHIVGMMGQLSDSEKIFVYGSILEFIRTRPELAGTAKENLRVTQALEQKLKSNPP
jgi:hypothetical protein